ncbi:DUF3179 domain-containing protein [Nocardiopsis sp. EMB25]|uniref:DUF3179 domain-containing protein n=1 Tax=Nocardiopsis sp. EMB25 TaxID=2835867 RepID=UPI00228513B7|nr:DUF3179 domain-containing protein [Nocardiopsis sp. EMB25]MCY9785250.1 DUF3179 domain-containing protein [Nocardiopsis sp. EMB25]
MGPTVRRAAATVALALAVGACQAAPPDDERPSSVSPSSDLGPYEDVPSAVEDPADPRLPDPLVDVDRLLSGGPPPDGIPALTDPAFEDAEEVDWLEATDPVMAVSAGGEERAYPVRILIWHEIVNDTIGGVPVAVTYCPLCDSALAFDRRVGDRTLDFGVSGMLYNSDLVMFDRQTHSLWPQIEGRAVAGTLTGTELDRVSVAVVSWEQWRGAYPDGAVLSRDTGHERDYGHNPYVGYDDPGTEPFLLDTDADPRLPAKSRVVGIGSDDTALAVPVDHVLESGVVAAEVDGEPVTVWARPGTTSALDEAVIAEGRETAVTGVFRPTLDGRELTFTADDDGFTDHQTGSRWNVLGHAVDGELESERLTPVDHLDTFWFAWVGFTPETEILR